MTRFSEVPLPDGYQAKRRAEEKMRITKEKLEKLTNRKRTSSQVRWFREHFGVDVPHDRLGPIITDSAYEKLVEKRLGLLPAANSETRPKPPLRLVDGINKPKAKKTA